MTCLFRWNGLTTTTAAIAIPGGTMGFGDVGSPSGLSYISANSLGPRFVIKTGNHPNRVEHRVIEGNDYATGNDIFYWSIPPTALPGGTLPGTYTGPWSARINMRFPLPIASMTFLQFREAGVANLAFTRLVGSSRIARVGTGNSATMASDTAWYRIEIQADPDRTTQLVWRVYREDGTVPISGFQDAATSVAWDEIRLGYLSTNFNAVQAYFGEIEIHDDYDLGGQFRSSPNDGVTPASATATGAPSFPPTIPARYRYDSATNRTVARSTPTYTLYSNVEFATTPAVYGRRVDVYVPDGTPPDGGWPLLMWAHSGFFSDGSKSDLPTQWRNEMLANGYAIASVDYVKTTIDPIPSYDSYGTSDTDGPGFARYPSFIVDFKVATHFMKTNHATYSINPDKVFATGYSAGGYLALAAAMTKGLSVDSGGTKLTIAGATSDGNAWGAGLSVSDPSYLGCMVFAAPIDMDLARNWDPTHPNSGSLIRQAAYRAFQALIIGSDAPLYPRQSIASHISLNTLGNLCPVLYFRGTSDFLVHWEHEDALNTAMVAQGGDYTCILTPNNHDHANDIFDADEQLPWLNALAYPETSETTGLLYYHDGSDTSQVSEEFYNGADTLAKQLYVK
jgi:acetyl esterase/lipase